MTPSSLISYLESRAEVFTFLTADLERSIAGVFADPSILPLPYKIYYADESRPSTLGFPVEESEALQQLDRLLDGWLDEEIQALRDPNHRGDRIQQAFDRYLNQTIRLAENAMLSNLLSDYHAVFWLSHSVQLSRRFSELPRRVLQTGKSNPELVKYRTFARWSSASRELMTQMASRLKPILDGEEERSLRFFRLLQDNVLILTEQFIGPDLRELRPYLSGCLHKDAALFRQRFEEMLQKASHLLATDKVFRNAAHRIVPIPRDRVTPALLIDVRFREYLLEHPSMEGALTRDEQELFGTVLRRLGEFAVLHQLRNAIMPMITRSEGDIVSRDDATIAFSRSTRPLDFARPGVVDPMVHRFGLMYDISAFSETLGSIARTGRKGELNSYRQMLLFQRKLERITEHHRLQFEKFLGDGAFYTTRRATRLLYAAVEIQQFYAEMRRRGFAFDKGLRIAINYGYYRLLPTQRRPNSNERVMEFYGPGVVELSRLTTGKSTREIEEIQTFLVSHGYESSHVHQFFAPLSHGVDVVDHTMHEREFYAYVNANGHLVNEGIVASMTLLEELANQIIEESIPLSRLLTPWGAYLALPMSGGDMDYVGLRLIGHVSLKGLAKTEVAEVIACREGDARVEPVEPGIDLVRELRQSHAEKLEPDGPVHSRDKETKERVIPQSILICSTGNAADPLIMIGEWDPTSNDLHRSIRLAGSDLQRLLGLETPLRLENVESRKRSLQDLYRKMSAHENIPLVHLAPFRQRTSFVAFVLGDHVEPV